MCSSSHGTLCPPFFPLPPSCIHTQPVTGGRQSLYMAYSRRLPRCRSGGRARPPPGSAARALQQTTMDRAALADRLR